MDQKDIYNAFKAAYFLGNYQQVFSLWTTLGKDDMTYRPQIMSFIARSILATEYDKTEKGISDIAKNKDI